MNPNKQTLDDIIPDGWEFVRLGTYKAGEYVLFSNGPRKQTYDGSPTTYGGCFVVVRRKIVKKLTGFTVEILDRIPKHAEHYVSARVDVDGNPTLGIRSGTHDGTYEKCRALKFNPIYTEAPEGE